MSNIDDFTAKDIFFKDEEGNTLYKRDNTVYIVNDVTLQKELQDIEGYRSFLSPRTLRAVIIFPVMFLSAIILLILYQFLDDIDDFYALVFYFTFFMTYGYVKYLYHRNINAVLKQCSIKKEPMVQKKKVYKEPSSKILPKNRTVPQQPIEKVYYQKHREPFMKRFKQAIPDFNFFHIVMFILIAFPFLFVVYAIIFN